MSDENRIVRLSVNLAPDVADALTIMAEAEGVTVTAMVQRCISAKWFSAGGDNRLAVLAGREAAAVAAVEVRQQGLDAANLFLAAECDRLQAERDAAVAAVARARARISRTIETVEDFDNARTHAHDDPTEGDPECTACWLATLDEYVRALDGAGDEPRPGDDARGVCICDRMGRGASQHTTACEVSWMEARAATEPQRRLAVPAGDEPRPDEPPTEPRRPVARRRRVTSDGVDNDRWEF